MEYMLKVLPRSPSSSWKDWSHFALDCLKGDIDVARAFCRRYILPDQCVCSSMAVCVRQQPLIIVGRRALRGLLANASEHGELIVLSVGELLSVSWLVCCCCSGSHTLLYRWTGTRQAR